jgi:DNA helicase-2/ATP-dependent DNA helicase PcrA
MSLSPESTRLVAALAELNDRQREASVYDGDVVVLAGPGSGKTRVLTVRAAYLLATAVPRRSALAAITFTNAAADEMRERLGQLGLPRSRRIAVSTAHAFCLNEVLLTHRDLLPTSLPDTVKILSERASSKLSEAVLGAHGLETGFDAKLALTRTRRAIAMGVSGDGINETLRAAADAYAQLLITDGALDFEEVVIRALEALRDPTILSLMVNRFTHLLVDEYQDLGEVLHAIVITMLEGGTQISAVGDPNQSILGFTGASPTFLLELCDRQDFETVQLEVNYRSAASLVSAAARFIDAKAPTQRHVRDTEGVIHHLPVEGDQSAHANAAVSVVEEQLASGASPGEIALLYPRKGPFLTALLHELDSRGIEYFHDRAEAIPKGPVARWISRCALRALSPDTPGALLPIDLTIPALSYELGRLTQKSSREFRRDCGRKLAERLQLPHDPGQPANEFTTTLTETLGIRELIAAASDEADQEDFARLLGLTDVPVSGLASSISPTSLTVTTYQSAKGREFDVVVMPGLVEGSVPLWPPTGPPDWVRNPPDEESLREERRAFYVALTI